MRSVETNAVGCADPALLFIGNLANDDRFHPCMSKYEIDSYLTIDGEEGAKWREATFKMFNSGMYVYVEDDKSIGFASFYFDFNGAHYSEVVKLQHLWVDPRYEKQGYAKKILEGIKKAADDTDSQVKIKTSGKHCFNLMLFPLPFDMYYNFKLDELYNDELDIDFGLEMLGKDKDNTSTNLSSYIRPTEKMWSQNRPGSRDLRKMYIKAGFVESHLFTKKTILEDNKFKRKLFMHPGNYVMEDRQPLIYPSSNTDYWNDFEKRMIEIEGLGLKEAIETGNLDCWIDLREGKKKMDIEKEKEFTSS